MKKEYILPNFEEIILDLNDEILTSGYQIKDSLPMGGDVDETI